MSEALKLGIPDLKKVIERKQTVKVTNAGLEDTAIRNLDTTTKKSTAPIVNNTPKVGRNDPCPCGSGKKYKNCCGKNA